MRVEVNGKQVEIKNTPIDTSRSAGKLKGDILRWLQRIGIEPEYVSIDTNTHGYEDPYATVKWVVNGTEYEYTSKRQSNITNNLAAVEQLVHNEVLFIERGIKTFGQVMDQFRIGYDPDGPKIKSPYEVLEVTPVAAKDAEYLKYQYKRMVKKYHPDNAETGDAERFRQVKEAYEELSK